MSGIPPPGGALSHGAAAASSEAKTWLRRPRIIRVERCYRCGRPAPRPAALTIFVTGANPMKRIILGLAAAVLMTGAAWAADPAMTADSSLGKILVDANGMTLYTFDKDTKGATMSACTDKCIAAWPPLVAAAGAMAEGEWTIVDATDKDGK